MSQQRLAREQEPAASGRRKAQSDNATVCAVAVAVVAAVAVVFAVAAYRAAAVAIETSKVRKTR